MSFPDFFDLAPRLTLRDPLAAFLGSPPDGILTYGYGDAVRLAGHSCPVVAGAYLMIRAGLEWIYDSETPERGDIEVHFRDRPQENNVGVMASVATLLTGAATEAGFGGIGPARRFARRGLLAFEAPVDGLLAMRRRSDGRGVVLDIDTGAVPHDPAMSGLVARVIAAEAPPEDEKVFARLWQDRVKRMLIDHADDPKLIHVYEWEQDR